MDVNSLLGEKMASCYSVRELGALRFCENLVSDLLTVELGSHPMFYDTLQSV